MVCFDQPVRKHSGDFRTEYSKSLLSLSQLEYFISLESRTCVHRGRLV